MAHDDPFAGQTVQADWAYYLDTAAKYTPALTANTTDPTLGTGAVQAGWWQRNGHLITGGAIIQFGTSGTNAGSGSYRVSLPFDADVSTLTASSGVGDVIGSGILRDSSGASSTWKTCSPWLGAASFVFMLSADAGIVSAGTPWAWAASDSIQINFAYLADPAGLPT